MIGDPTILTPKEKRTIIGMVMMCISLALFVISAIEFANSIITYALLVCFLVSGGLTVWSLMGYTKLQTSNVNN